MLNIQITTDCSVFNRFCFACVVCLFDESMASIGGYEPYRTCNTVGLTPIQIKNEFITVPWSGVLFSFANGAYEFSVKFCVVKFSSFG